MTYDVSYILVVELITCFYNLSEWLNLYSKSIDDAVKLARTLLSAQTVTFSHQVAYQFVILGFAQRVTEF